MSKWDLKIRKNTREVIHRLKNSFDSKNSFVFNLDETKNDFIKFEIRKRAHHMFQISNGNIINANGVIFKGTTTEETDIQIDFSHHILTKLLIAIYLISCLVMIIFIQKMTENPYIIVGSVICAIILGTLSYLEIKSKFEKNIMKYKKLISEILE